MANLSFGNKSVKDILAEAAKVLNLKPTAQKEYYSPCRTVLYYEFLGELTGKPILHFYDKILPEELHLVSGDFDILCHSHPHGSGCFAPTFCHVFGYEPTGLEHPSFIKAFKQKWQQNEKEIQHNPERLSQSDGLSGITFRGGTYVPPKNSGAF